MWPLAELDLADAPAQSHMYRGTPHMNHNHQHIVRRLVLKDIERLLFDALSKLVKPKTRRHERASIFATL